MTIQWNDPALGKYSQNEIIYEKHGMILFYSKNNESEGSITVAGFIKKIYVGRIHILKISSQEARETILDVFLMKDNAIEAYFGSST